MLAPWPTKNDVVALLLPCLTAFSIVSEATVVVTVYLPLTAVQVPIVTGPDEAPAASAPDWVPVIDFTVVPLASFTTIVSAWAPLPEAMLPWFFTSSVKVTVLPAAGLPGDQAAVGTRSELWIGVTTRLAGLV